MRRHAGRVALAVVLSAASAHAGGDPSTEADDLFQKAKPLLQSGRWSEACPLLAASYRLDPAGGTLQNLAVCYESAGKWASAVARFNELKVLAKKANPPRVDRIKLADEHLAKVTPKVSHLVVTLPATAPPDAVVEIEAVQYDSVAWSAGIALDPGPHEVLVTAAKYKPYRATVTIPNERSDDQKLVVPALEPLPVEEKLELSNDRHSNDEKEQREKIEQARTARRTGYFIGGGGLVLLAGAATFGALTIAKNNAGNEACSQATNDAQHYNGHCVNHSAALETATSDKSSARSFAILTDVLGGAGLVAVAVGAYFVFVRGAVQVAPTVGGAIATGVF